MRRFTLIAVASVLVFLSGLARADDEEPTRLTNANIGDGLSPGGSYYINGVVTNADGGAPLEMEGGATLVITEENGAVGLLINQGSIVNDDGTITVKAKGTLQNEKTVAIGEHGRLIFESGALYAGAGTITNSGFMDVNVDKVSDNTGNIFKHTILTGNGEIKVSGVGTGPTQLVLHGNTDGGLVRLSEGGDFLLANTYGASLYIGGTAETRFQDTVTSAGINVANAEGTVFGNTVTVTAAAGMEVETKATFASDSGLVGNLTVKTDAEVINNTTGGIDFAAGAVVKNDGSIVNGGDMSFAADSSYISNGGEIIQQSGTLGLSTNMSGSGFNDAFADTKLKGGDLELTGDGTGIGPSLTLAEGHGGSTVRIRTDDGTTFGSVDVKEAKLSVEANTVFTGAITSSNEALNAVGVKEDVTAEFRDQVHANLTNNGTVVNNVAGGMVIEADRVVVNNKTIESWQDLTFKKNSSYYADTGAAINVSAGQTLSLDTGMTAGFATAFNTANLTDATLKLTGNDNITKNLILSSATGPSTVVIATDAGTEFAGVNVKDAMLDVENRTIFNGAVESANTGEEAIAIRNGAVFKGAVKGNVKVKGGTAEFGASSSYGNGNMRVAGSAAAKNYSTAGLRIEADKSLTIDAGGEFHNLRNAGTNTNALLVFEADSTFDNGGTFTNSGTVTADIDMRSGFSDLTTVGTTLATQTSVLNLANARGSVATLGDLDFTGAAEGSRVQLQSGAGVDYGNIKTGDATLVVDSGEARMTTDNFIATSSHGNVLINRGAELSLNGPGGIGTISTGRTDVAGAMTVRADNKLRVESDLSFYRGAVINLEANSSGVSQILSTGSITIGKDGPGNFSLTGDQVAVKISGVASDVLGQVIMIADSGVDGYQNLNCILYSLEEVALDTQNNNTEVYAPLANGNPGNPSNPDPNNPDPNNGSE